MNIKKLVLIGVIFYTSAAHAPTNIELFNAALATYLTHASAEHAEALITAYSELTNNVVFISLANSSLRMKLGKTIEQMRAKARSEDIMTNNTQKESETSLPSASADSETESTLTT